MADTKLHMTCVRCGAQRHVFVRAYTLQAERAGEYIAKLCGDCRGAEKSRQKPSYVPNDVIKHLVQQMKEGKK